MRMIKQNYRREMAHAGPTRAQLDRLWRTMDDPARPRPPRGRTVLAAVLAAIVESKGGAPAEEAPAAE